MSVHTQWSSCLRRNHYQPCLPQSKRTINWTTISNWHTGMFPFIRELCTWKLLTGEKLLFFLFLIPKKAHVHLNCSEAGKWRVRTLTSYLSFQKCLRIKLLMSILHTHTHMHCTIDFPPHLSVHLSLYNRAHGAPTHQRIPVPENIHASEMLVAIPW